MLVNFLEINKAFKYNGISYDAKTLKQLSSKLIDQGDNFEQITGRFLLDWLSDDDYLYAETSGSTGTPKRIKLQKKAMVNSAMATGLFFNLKAGDTALNCLSSDYIAGKMMLVRAMVLGLEIDCVTPQSKPKINAKKTYDFCAMVPLQVGNSLENLTQIKTVIVGGSKIVSHLLERIKNSSVKFYETYGMTETVTHVALKPLESLAQKGEDYFKALPHITFSIDHRNCLLIDAPNILNQPIVTNDVVDLKSNTQFKWLGRFDNVINSGGIKLFPEQIEEEISKITNKPIIIASEPDDVLGEKLILIIETSQTISQSLKEKISGIKTLSKYQIPKVYYNIDNFARTSSQKIQRQKTIDLVLK